MNSNPTFSFFRRPIQNLTPCAIWTLEDAWRYITSSEAAEVTKQLRSLTTKDNQRKCKKGLKKMTHFYTINYKLFGSRKDDEKLIDAQTTDLAYRTRENAFKGVQERIKTHIELCDYKRTDNDLVIETAESETGIKFRIEFEIKEHWLSDYEKED